MATASRGGPQVPFRLTPQRAAVLAAVRRAPDHPTARTIWERVRADQPGIGFATVYRALSLLTEHREILELQLGDEDCSRYDRNLAPHDHVRCTGCKSVADIPSTLPPSAAAHAAAASGFAITGYDLQYRGHCPRCVKTES